MSQLIKSLIVMVLILLLSMIVLSIPLLGISSIIYLLWNKVMVYLLLDPSKVSFLQTSVIAAVITFILLVYGKSRYDKEEQENEK